MELLVKVLKLSNQLDETVFFISIEYLPDNFYLEKNLIGIKDKLTNSFIEKLEIFLDRYWSDKVFNHNDQIFQACSDLLVKISEQIDQNNIVYIEVVNNG